MVVQSTGIGALPNELLITLLSSFPTRALLPLTTVSHRFHDLILRILHTRLIHAASLKDHKLILEVFHPSTKLSTPYLLCDYLGTDGLSDEIEGEGDIYTDVNDTGRLGKLSSLYSHFRPVQPEEDKKIVRSHPAGGPLTNPSWLGGLANGFSEKQDSKYVCQNVNLDSHELFSQLCTITNLVKVGPRRGLFLSCVNIGEGITRVWRHWLAERAAALVAPSKFNNEPSTSSGESVDDPDFERRLLWADSGKNVGLRIRVCEREDIPAPILVRRDEDAPVSYTLQYEELVIKTTQLLLKVEQSLEQEVNHSGMTCGLDGVYMSAIYLSNYWLPLGSR